MCTLVGTEDRLLNTWSRNSNNCRLMQPDLAVRSKSEVDVMGLPWKPGGKCRLHLKDCAVKLA